MLNISICFEHDVKTKAEPGSGPCEMERLAFSCSSGSCWSDEALICPETGGRGCANRVAITASQTRLRPRPWPLHAQSIHSRKHLQLTPVLSPIVCVCVCVCVCVSVSVSVCLSVCLSVCFVLFLSYLSPISLLPPDPFLLPAHFHCPLPPVRGKRDTVPTVFICCLFNGPSSRRTRHEDGRTLSSSAVSIDFWN